MQSAKFLNWWHIVTRMMCEKTSHLEILLYLNGEFSGILIPFKHSFLTLNQWQQKILLGKCTGYNCSHREENGKMDCFSVLMCWISSVSFFNENNKIAGQLLCCCGKFERVREEFLATAALNVSLNTTKQKTNTEKINIKRKKSAW